MTCAEARKEFIKTSKRYDLLVGGSLSDNVDNGANAFLNAGQRFLDRKTDHPAGRRRYMVVFASGACTLEIQNLRRVEHLYLKGGALGETRSDITPYHMSLEDFFIEYGGFISTWTSGTPTYWARNVIGLAPQLLTATSGSFATAGIEDYTDVHFGQTSFNFNGLIFYPKADADYTVDMHAMFYSPTLSDDADISLWTVEHPQLLALAATYVCRNSEGSRSGASDILMLMAPELDDIINDIVDIELENANLTGESYDKSAEGYVATT